MLFQFQQQLNVLIPKFDVVFKFEFPAATRLSSTLSSDRRELAEVLQRGMN